MQGKDYISFILEEKDQIKDFVGKISMEMYDYMEENKDSKFILFYKYITHSDLPTFGKATKINSHHKNLLYYIDEEEMKNIEQKTNKPFQTAHQSCIGLKSKLYDLVGLPNPRETDPYLINDYMNVNLVNSNLEYFSSVYTKMIFDKLNKCVDEKSRFKKLDNSDIELSGSKFTTIELHCAVHGLGISNDVDFHKLRHHIFKGDTFLLLFELNDNFKNMFIMLEKNPTFFSIIGKNNKSYEAYQELTRKRMISNLLNKTNAIDDKAVNDLENEITRQQQSTWRKMLANEMMGYTQINGEVFCPFTYITADFNTLGTLFIASHIKGFRDPNTTNEEKYDINNGLLLCANVDALFDKHYISIDENKELVFSYLLDTNFKLKQQLLLMQPIFKPLLNEKRMEYLKYHYSKFLELEEKRKSD